MVQQSNSQPGVRLHMGVNSDMTVEMDREDHTLGNALRYAIMKNARAEFCSYSVPHPSEHVIHLRVQAAPVESQEQQTGRVKQEDDAHGAHGAGNSAAHVQPLDLVHQGLDDLVAMCDAVKRKLEAAVETYKLATPSGMIKDETHPMQVDG